MNNFLYGEIINFIKAQIISGKIQENDLLPSEAQMSKKFQVSRMTVRQAYNELEKEGLIYRVRGKGTFANSSLIRQPLGKLSSFTEEVKLLGSEPGNKLISKKIIKADKKIASNLNIKENEETLEIIRSRFIDNKVFSLNTSYFPVNKYPEFQELDFNSLSIYKLIESEIGLAIKWADQFLSAVAATKNEAQLLEVEEGTPLLYLRRITYIVNDVPIEAAMIVFRPDRYSFKIKLKR